MGKPSIPALIRLEDYPKEMREAFGTLSKGLNPFMEDTYRQLNGQIGFDNMTRIMGHVDIKIDSTGAIVNEPQVSITRLKSKPVGLNVIKAENRTNLNVYPTNAPFLSWDIKANTIIIKNATGLPANSEWRLTLEIIGN